MINISDFNITGKPIPQDIADKIVKYHLIDLWEVEKVLPYEIFISQNSGYRPYSYEIAKGRKGNSQHCFFGKGAADITCENFKENKEELLKALIEKTGYTRFAVYNSFCHVDFAHQIDNRWVFNSKWERLYEVEVS